MIQLKLVKTSLEEANKPEQEDGALNHGTQVLLRLVRPWLRTDRLVCADSYFASVQTAKELLRVGLRFIGVVKTATRLFPMAHLASKELSERGDRYGVICNKDNDNNNQAKLLAFVWVDRDRRYFIASCSSLQEGRPQVRQQWRQLVKDLTTPPEKMELVIPQPIAVETYYAVCSKVDQLNRDRQSTLSIERKFKTLDWSMRVNLTILSMCIVDAWRVWSRINR